MQNSLYVSADLAVRQHPEPPGLSRHAKRKGELAELAFVLKASSLGLAVCKPYGDNFPFDLVVESAGRSVRIQVKSAFRPYRTGFQFITTNGHDGARHVYTAQEIDFLAAYIVPRDLWYIIPVHTIGTRKKVRLYPDGLQRVQTAGLFEQFREAWQLITRDGQRTA